MTALSRLYEAIADAATPVDRKSLADFITQDLHIPSEFSAVSRIRPWAYQVALADAIDRVIATPSIRQITLLKSARTGFTLILSAALLRELQTNPGPLALVFPGQTMCDDMAKTSIEPLLRDNAQIGDLLTIPLDSQRHKAGTYPVPGGSLKIRPMVARTLRGFGFRIVVIDELDQCPTDLEGEGDPVTLSRKRCETFQRDQMLLVGGSPSTYDGLTAKHFSAGTREIWAVQCPHCDDHFSYGFERDRTIEMLGDDAVLPVPVTGLKFKREGGLKVWLDCPSCGATIDETEKDRLNSRGKFVGCNPEPDPGHRSFWIWSAYSENVSWSGIVNEFLSVKSNPAHLKAWVNTTLGMPWAEASDRIKASDIKSSDFGDAAGDALPDDAVLVTVGVDCQKDRLEAIRTAFGPNGEAWIVDHAVLRGDTNLPESHPDSPWGALEEYRLRPSQHPKWGRLPVTAMCVDHGYRSQMVERFVRPRFRQGVYAVKGASNVPNTVVPTRNQMERKVNGEPAIIDVNAIKNEIYTGLLLDPGVPGKLNVPNPGARDWCTQDFWKQLRAEERVQDPKTGREVYKRVKKGTPAEVIDGTVYCFAAAKIMKCFNITPEKKLRQFERIEAEAAGQGQDIAKVLDDRRSKTKRPASQRKRYSVASAGRPGPIM
ncbi:MAG: terminase gpA endonuclease subunit [Rhodospirillaceae bacterium]